MRDYHFTPESYLTMMREAVPGYDRLEDETLAATGVGAKSVLELGWLVRLSSCSGGGPPGCASGGNVP